MIELVDDVLADPAAYLAGVQRRTFSDVQAGRDTFKGISVSGGGPVERFAEQRTGARSVLSFFRRSPLGQVEPNFVHSDEAMGRFTGIFYLNPDPPEGDGTVFWERDGADWKHVRLVSAKFNRLLIFDAGLHHSRALFDNYGQGDSARLIQVIFLR